ncbi:hypothetical protein B0H14DRAFT_2658808 [Mycena olivaceomarginata]|nr:hypothetical protein B0H14DRAFT_2658808 [Mycena olivaceomarginata]
MSVSPNTSGHPVGYASTSSPIGYQPGTETREPSIPGSTLPYSTRRGWPLRRMANPNDRQPKLLRGLRRIRCALPGAITNSAILVLIFSPPPTFLINLFQVTWLHSADTTLTEIGDQMSINYRARHSYYLQHIVEALANSPDSADGSAGREIEEDNNFFAGAHASPVALHSFFHIAASPPSHTLPTLSATYPCSILEQAGAGKLRVDFAQRPFPFPAVFAAPQRGPTSLLNAWL